MNIKITHNWLKEYLDTKATPEEIQKYLSLCGPSIESVTKSGDDYIYDIEITSNRIDTASVYGIAREAATILNRFGIKAKFKPLKLEEPIINPVNQLPLIINDPDKLCRRIMAVVLDNVKIGPSPEYVKKRLEAAGIRSLNNLVDITNYVMTEIGRPTHVFDYDRIKTNKLIFRHARNKEEIITLDEKKYLLDIRDVIIDDGTSRVIDLPGIMGTANSVVAGDTKRIIFFIEANNPVATRRSSIRHGIRTVAATINEKSPDPENVKPAMLRGIELFHEFTGAKIAGPIIDIYPHPPKPVSINTSVRFISERIGIDIPKKQIIGILTDLDFKVNETDGNFTIEVPSFRGEEVTIAEDIVEEVARIYGYFNLPNNLQPAVYIKQPKDMETLFDVERRIKYFLKHLGLHEVINYSMISKEMIENNDLDPKKHLVLKNTISEDIKYMRTHIMPSLIKNIRDNEGKEEKLQLFEIAKTYKPRTGELPLEEYKLGIVTNTGVSDLKGIIDSLLEELHITGYEIKKSVHPLLSDHNQAQITIGNDWIGEFGQLKPVYQIKNNVKSKIFMAVFDLSSILKYFHHISNTYKPVNPYSVIKLDLTIEQNPAFPYQLIKKKAYETSRLLTGVELIDAYQNNITLRFYFSSSERNINEEEAKDQLDRIKQVFRD